MLASPIADVTTVRIETMSSGAKRRMDFTTKVPIPRFARDDKGALGMTKERSG
jgi:hypothetical protein